MAVIYLDFQKTFDKGLHTKLIFKTKRYGISSEIVRRVGRLTDYWTGTESFN